MRAVGPITVDDVRAAALRIAPHAVRTPLVRLGVEEAPAEIWLKLENLQPIGAFKIRGAANAILQLPRESLAAGVYTASAGNMAQGVGWMARALGIPFTVIVPEHAPEAKLAAIRRLGGTIIPLPFDDWWQVLVDHGFPGQAGCFVHPVSDPAVIAGNGTIGLEIVEDLPDVTAVVIPYGGGGLSSGIATAVRALAPRAKLYAGEVATSAAFAAALAAGEPVAAPYTPTFIDGIGSRTVLPGMWPLVRSLLDDSLVVSPAEVVDAIRLMIERNRIVAEGAGATPVAAALAGKAGGGKVVCVVSGGNIDSSRLATILGGAIP